MRCCNVAHGCEFVGVLDEVTTHFLKDCTFHVVTCNRCNAAILRNDIVHHYTEQRCQAASSSTNYGNEVRANENIVDTESKMNDALDAAMGRLCAIETQLNVHVVSINGAKRGISANGQALSRLLDLQEQTSGVMRKQIEELTKCLHTGKRMLSDAISPTSAAGVSHTSSMAEHDNDTENAQKGGGGAAALQHSSDQTGSEVIDDVNKIGEALKVVFDACKRISFMDRKLGALELLLTNCKNNVAYYHIQDFNDIEKESVSMQVNRWSETLVLCGYSSKLHVQIDTIDGMLYLGVFLSICRSSRDSCLKWPFALPYKIMLVHPTDEKKNIEFHVNVLEYIDSKSMCFIKPAGDNNSDFGARRLCELQIITKEGFVHNNSISVGVKIISPVC
ncbi:uncharacterized protein LOC135393287 [Ornithodoros turicata]|uniref:uncharacterized protein LOC135393287 n=1 Tax=Ornithodoros turicata TaxID=34597 RepID=UPI00313A3ECB